MAAPQDPAHHVQFVFEPSEGIKAGTNPAQVHYFGQRSKALAIMHRDTSQAAVTGP